MGFHATCDISNRAKVMSRIESNRFYRRLKTMNSIEDSSK